MGFEKPLQELDLGEILGQTFNLYFSKFILFFLPFLVAGLFVGGWGKAVGLMLPMPVSPDPTASPDVLLSYLFSALGVVVATFFLTTLVSSIIDTIARGMAVKVASDVLEKHSVDLSETLSYTVSRLFSLLGAGIITGILIIVGLICLVVPGIIFAVMFSLIVPAIMIERVGAIASLSRSRRLVGGRWLKTFGLLLVIYIIIIVASWIFGVIGSFFGPADWVVSSILGAFVSPILPIALTLYYHSMVAKEQPSPPLQPTPPAAPETQPSSPKSSMIHCIHCRTENPTEAAFCQKCGKEIIKPT